MQHSEELLHIILHKKHGSCAYSMEKTGKTESSSFIFIKKLDSYGQIKSIIQHNHGNEKKSSSK